MSPDKIKTYYNEQLRLVENDLKNSRSTTNIELENYCKKKIKNFVGVYASDYIFILNHGESAIINVDDSSKLGSHWLAFINDHDITYVYDSFGRTIKKLIPRFYKYHNTNPNIEQSIYEDNCGQRCIAFLLTFKKFGLDTIDAI